MKVAISGTHAVGKSTMVDHISEKYAMRKVGEKATELLKSKYKFEDVESNFNYFMDFETDILGLQLNEENRIWEAPMVVDRPFIDSFAYIHLRYLMENKDADDRYDVMVGFAHERMLNPEYRYNLIFFIRYNPIFSEGNPEIRNMNSLYQREIDIILERWYKTFARDVNVIHIDTPIFEERCQIVDSYLGYLGGTKG